MKNSNAEIQRHTEMIRQKLYAVLLNANEGYRVLSQLRGAEHQFDLQWIRLSQDSPMADRSIGESEIRKTTDTSVVGIIRDGRLKPNPDAGYIAMPENLLAIIGNKRDREAFCHLAASPV